MDHMTIAPKILQELADMAVASTSMPSLFNEPLHQKWDKASYLEDKVGFVKELKEEDKDGRLGEVGVVLVVKHG